MKPNTLITAEKLKEIAEKAENFEEPEVKVKVEKDDTVPENETLDQMAARELMEEAKNIKKEVEKEKLVVPINAKPVMDGQAEVKFSLHSSISLSQHQHLGCNALKCSYYYKHNCTETGIFCEIASHFIIHVYLLLLHQKYCISG